MPRRLTRELYLAGMQCRNRLWLRANRTDLIPEPSKALRHLAAERSEVVGYARELFPGGELVSEPSALIAQALRRTEALAGDGGPRFVYDAAFAAGDAVTRCDIIERNYDGTWDLLVVKAAEAFTEGRLPDAAYRRYIMEGAGLKVAKVLFLHLDPAYVRHGRVEPAKLFKSVDITAETARLLPQVEKNIREFSRASQEFKQPDHHLGRWCVNPADCEFSPLCRAGLPGYSIYDIPRLSWEKKDLLRLSGELKFAELRDESLLDETQRLYLRVERTGEPHIDRKAVDAFLRTLKYPLHYLDFETLQPAVPLYDRSRPMRQLVFQFSLHVQDVPGGPVRHVEHLGDHYGDPRPGLVKALLANIGPAGSLVAYNSGFEAARIKEMAEDLHEFAPPLLRLPPRFVDLMEPFRRLAYVHPDFKGHYSLKKVLPALVPGMSYNDLPIGNGADARLAFDDLARGKAWGPQADKLRADLLAYCGLDTLAMVKITERLYAEASAWRGPAA